MGFVWEAAFRPGKFSKLYSVQDVCNENMSMTNNKHFLKCFTSNLFQIDLKDL